MKIYVVTKWDYDDFYLMEAYKNKTDGEKAVGEYLKSDLDYDYTLEEVPLL